MKLPEVVLSEMTNHCIGDEECANFILNTFEGTYKTKEDLVIGEFKRGRYFVRGVSPLKRCLVDIEQEFDRIKDDKTIISTKEGFYLFYQTKQEYYKYFWLKSSPNKMQVHP